MGDKRERGKAVWIADALLDRVDDIVERRKAETPWRSTNRQAVVNEYLALALRDDEEAAGLAAAAREAP